MEHRKLYHLDSTGKTRVWWMESEGNRYRTHSGILNGAIVTSEWTVAEGKNIGRSNETTPEQQALSEVESTYQHKLARKYSEVLEEAKRSNIFQPMLAEKYKPGKTKDKRYYWQPKLDGVRCIMTSEGAFSREGKPFFTVSHIYDHLKPLLDCGFILDGELYNHDLKDDFDKLVSMIRQQKIEKLSQAEMDEIREKVQYHIYDMIEEGAEMTPFERRHNLLSSFYDPKTFCPTNTEKVWTQKIESLAELEEAHGWCTEQGYEGIMLRDPDSPYENKRSKGLLKHKDFLTEEFEVVDIEPGLGNWSGMAKKVVLRLPDGRTFKSGIRGSQAQNRQRLIEKEKYIGGDAACRFQNYTPDGIPRFGVVITLYGGKRDI